MIITKGGNSHNLFPLIAPSPFWFANPKCNLSELDSFARSSWCAGISCRFLLCNRVLDSRKYPYPTLTHGYLKFSNPLHSRQRLAHHWVTLAWKEKEWCIPVFLLLQKCRYVCMLLCKVANHWNLQPNFMNASQEWWCGPLQINSTKKKKKYSIGDACSYWDCWR